MPKPKLTAPAATPWGSLVAGTVGNPAVLRTALQQTLVRVLAAAHGQPPRTLLVLLIGPGGPGSELGHVVQRIADSLRMEPHLAVDVASRTAALERAVTWRVIHCASELGCAAVLEGVKLGTDSVTAETMCVLTRNAPSGDEISLPVSLLDVLLWLWPTRSGSSSKRKTAATEDTDGEPTTP